MISYADYSYYAAEYSGSLIPSEQFTGYAKKASAYLDFVTFGRITEPTDAVRLACCAVAEEYFRQDQHAGISSESVGNLSVTYLNAGDQRKKRALFHAAQLYLSETGLLFKGAVQ